jgi:hypothetical protein
MIASRWFGANHRTRDSLHAGNEHRRVARVGDPAISEQAG